MRRTGVLATVAGVALLVKVVAGEVDSGKRAQEFVLKSR